jgi:hypothetical protein
MNRFPLWKNALIAIVMALGVVYTVPNLFGEVPAVQVLPNRPGLKADTALMGKVEEALKAGSVRPNAVASDERSVRVRLSSTDEQLKARDLLQQALGSNYIVALSLQSASPLPLVVAVGVVAERSPSLSPSMKQTAQPLQSSSMLVPLTSGLPGKRLALLSSQSSAAAVARASPLSEQSASDEMSVAPSIRRWLSLSASS